MIAQIPDRSTWRMLLNNTRKGARQEHKSKAILEAAGYEVIRASGSHGLFDLIAVSAHEIVLVQVKSRDWPYALEREQLEAFVVPSNCRKLVHRWRDGCRIPDVLEL